MQIKYFYLSIFICLWVSSSLFGQTPKPSFTLYENETGTRLYKAGSFVKLKPGFTYKAETGSTFKACIIDTAFTITAIPNPQPGSVDPQADKPYTPGGSFGNDPVESGNGVSAILKIPGINNVPAKNKVIATPLVWFKTVPVTNNLNGAYEWKDVTGNAVVKKYNTAGASTGDSYTVTREKLVAYNFNPSIEMSYDNISKEILVKNSNLSQTTIIGIWGITQEYDLNRFMFAINGRRKESIVFSKNTVGETDANKTDLAFGNDTIRNFLYRSNPVLVEKNDVNKFREKNIRTGIYYRSNQPDNSLWGEKKQAVISLGAKFDTTNVNNTSSFKAIWHNLPTIKGFTPELLVFDRQITPAEGRIYESYLGIKYGLTLDKSYVDAKDSVIWNSVSNKSFHNRVTGYAREDATGLNQKMSTTSYAEAPSYSNLTTNDTYHSGDSYQLASASRLLVAGIENGNNMPDGKYVIFGDNNEPFNQYDSVPGFKIMKRKWLLNTNMRTFSQGSEVQHLTWSDSLGLQFTENGNFNSYIFRAGNQSTVSAITRKPLNGPCGYFSWIVEQEYGPITVKFGAKQAGSENYDYGYHITIDGHIRAIIKGAVQPYNLFTVERGQKIEIEKNGNIMYLRVNGIRYKNTEIVIDEAHKGKSYYGWIIIGYNKYDIKLSSFRQGGFTDTGSKIELSYAANMASQLSEHRDKKTYLFIDRTGNGLFNESSERYLNTSFDTLRSKILFDNIFWDKDGSGKDYFTFGYEVPIRYNAIVKENYEVVSPDSPLEAKFLVYYKDIRLMDKITIELQTAKPSPAVIIMYDISGRTIFKQSYTEGSEAIYQDIQMPMGGVYIIKVVTNEKEYTRKIICKK